MLRILEKPCFYLIVFLFPVTAISQIMTHLETKNLSAILAIENQRFTIDSDTTITEERVEYYDGKGNVVYLFEYDHDLERAKHWMKQDDAPFKSYDIYTDGKRDAHFSEKKLNDSTYRFEYFAHDSLYVSTNIFLDSQTVLIIPDSTIVEMEFDSLRNFTEIKNIGKDGKIEATYKFEVLAIDEKGNWTERLERNISEKQEYTILHQRRIKYSDEYKISNYFELNIDTVTLDGRLITDPEALNPNTSSKLADEIYDEDSLDEKSIYESFQSLFYQKYFNSNYFLRFSTNREGAAKVLEDRLLFYYTTHVFDVRNEKHFIGRTQSNRWFDKTASFNRLEQLESPPVPTEKWVQVNGYNCREYLALGPNGGTNRFFVTEELPFINYCDFTFTLPGFVMKSERYIPGVGEVKLVVDLKECSYPFHFLEFLDGLNEAYGTEIMYLQRK